MRRFGLVVVATLISGPVWAEKLCPIQPGAVVCTDRESGRLVGSLFINSPNFEEQKAKALATGHCKVINKLTQVAERKRGMMPDTIYKNSYLNILRPVRSKEWLFVPDNFVTDGDGCGTARL